MLVAEPPGALPHHRPDGLLIPDAGSARPRSGARWLPVAAGLLFVGWGYLWIVRGAHGLAVHAVLLAAFALLAGWGVLRALPPRGDAGDVRGSDERWRR